MRIKRNIIEIGDKEIYKGMDAETKKGKWGLWTGEKTNYNPNVVYPQNGITNHVKMT